MSEGDNNKNEEKRQKLMNEIIEVLIKANRTVQLVNDYSINWREGYKYEDLYNRHVDFDFRLTGVRTQKELEALIFQVFSTLGYIKYPNKVDAPLVLKECNVFQLNVTGDFRRKFSLCCLTVQKDSMFTRFYNRQQKRNK